MKFRLFLIVCLVSITLDTSVTNSGHGLELLPVLFGDMAQMGWPGYG